MVALEVWSQNSINVEIQAPLLSGTLPIQNYTVSNIIYTRIVSKLKMNQYL